MIPPAGKSHWPGKAEVASFSTIPRLQCFRDSSSIFLGHLLPSARRVINRHSPCNSTRTTRAESGLIVERKASASLLPRAPLDNNTARYSGECMSPGVEGEGVHVDGEGGWGALDLGCLLQSLTLPSSMLPPAVVVKRHCHYLLQRVRGWLKRLLRPLQPLKWPCPLPHHRLGQTNLMPPFRGGYAGTGLGPAESRICPLIYPSD